MLCINPDCVNETLPGGALCQPCQALADQQPRRKEATKVDDAELSRRLQGCPGAGTRWRHYKTGALYFVQCATIDEATQKPLVVYCRWNSALLFSRPLAEWCEMVEWEGKRVARFAQVQG